MIMSFLTSLGYPKILGKKTHTHCSSNWSWEKCQQHCFVSM